MASLKALREDYQWETETVAKSAKKMKKMIINNLKKHLIIFLEKIIIKEKI